MSKFRKRPVVIEAVQYLHGNGAAPDGVCRCNEVPFGGQPHVHTLEGPLTVSDGDWIIRGVKGEYYPCKPDVFDATYDTETP